MKYESLPNRRWKLIHFLKLFRTNYQPEHCITDGKKQNNIQSTASRQNLVWLKVSLLPENGKDYENEFLTTPKKIEPRFH